MEFVDEVYDHLTLVQNKDQASHYDYRAKKYYKIEDTSYTGFWRNYCKWSNYTENKKNLKPKLSISNENLNEFDKENLEDDFLPLEEILKSNSRSPLILEFNLIFNLNNVGYKYGKFYDDDFIASIIYNTQKTIEENYLVDNTGKELVCCFLKAENDIKSNKVYSKFKLHFPNFKVRVSDINEIYSIVIQKLNQSNVINKLNYVPSNNNWSNIISTPTTKSTYPLYMCDSEKKPCSLNYIYTQIEAEQLLDESYKTYTNLDGFFYPNEHTDYIKGGFRPGIEEQKTHLWDSMFFSIKYNSKLALKKSNQNTEGLGNNLNIKIGRRDSEEEKKAKTFLNMLKKKRFDQFHFWTDIGKALFNVFDGNEDGLDLWKQLTEQSSKFTDFDCDEHYDTFSIGNNITLKTLGWYAREDSPALYQNWISEKCNEAITEALKNTRDWEVGKIFQIMFWLDYVCSKVKGGVWYKYERHRWNEIDNGSKIRNALSTTFTYELRKYERVLILRVDEASDKSLKSEGERMLNSLRRIIRDAGNINKKNTLVRQLADQMHDEDFVSLVDKNPNVLGVRNGIIETLDDKAVFRNGKPEDYISFQSRTLYNRNYTWDHPKVKAVMKWYRQLYPDEAEREYVLKVDSSFLEGQNKDKKMYVFSGNTNGGKSIKKKFFEAILGRYSFTLPEGEISSKKNRSGNGLKPGLALASKSNIAWVMENSDSISDTDLKLYTGNDMLFFRMMGENGENSIPRFKLIYVCNFVPLVPGADDAIFERMVIIPHKSIWTHDAPSSEEEQFKRRVFKRDNNFDKKLPGLASAGLWILVNYFKRYREEGLSIPESIKAETNKYWEENDMYGNFINDGIVEADEDYCIPFQEVYNMFSGWCKMNFPDQEPDNKPRVKKILTQRLNKKGFNVSGVSWKGIRLRNQHGYVGGDGGGYE